MADCINIILQEDKFDGSNIFVEIEDDKGNSVKIGEVIQGKKGLWTIRIRPEDIQKA